MVRLLALLFGLLAAGLAAYSLYDAFYGPPKVVLKHGSVTVHSIRDPGKPVERRTRHVQRGKDTFWEVELKSGSWLGCGGDCAEAYRREELEPWQTRKEESR